MRLGALFLVGVLACGGTTDSDPGDPDVIASMRVTRGDINFTVGERYVFADEWEASNGAGQILPLVDTSGKAIDRGLRYTFDDTVASHSVAVDTSGSVKLPQFIGFLYVFAPTARHSRELMGGHYMDVEP